MKASLQRHIKASPAKANLPIQPATKAQPWWAPDAVAQTPVAAPKPAPAAETPEPAKMNATVVAELARIAKRQ